MAIERTFSMIKPDATQRNLTGAITAKLEEAGLRVVASKRVWMSLKQAEAFYAVHSERPFFGELTEFMSPAPLMKYRALVLHAKKRCCIILARQKWSATPVLMI